MSVKPTHVSTGTKRIQATVPLEVANYLEAQATRFGGSVSSVVAPVLCAMARGEINQVFVQQPGIDTRPLENGGNRHPGR